jgi:hypothetical protein
VPSVDDVEVPPTAAPAVRLSPSAINALLACPRKLAHARDPSNSTWRRSTPRTALGVVAHALTEAASTEAMPEQAQARAAWLEGRWNSLIADQADILAAAWPNRAVPAPAAWPGYAITKVRLIRRLTREAPTLAGQPVQPTERSAAGPTGPTPAAALPLPWVERRLEAGQLFGTPDLVEEVDGQLRVVDLKAGVHQNETTPSQRRQLLLYASLVYSELGRLPDACVIRDARGTETTINVTQSEVDTVRAEAESAGAAFNVSITTPQGAPARPSKENCRWCDYRVVCSDYWRTRESDWPSTASDIIGTVTSASPPYTLMQLLDGDDVHRLILSPDETPAEGDLLVLVNTEKAGFQTSRPRWNSHVRVIPGDTASKAR